MQSQIITKNVRITPRKLRLVADMVRNMPLDQAINRLPLTDKRAAGIILKSLNSAVANAVNNLKLDRSSLFIKKLEVNQATVYKRIRPAARGRVHPYTRKGSSLLIVLDQKAQKAEKVLELKNSPEKNIKSKEMKMEKSKVKVENKKEMKGEKNKKWVKK